MEVTCLTSTAPASPTAHYRPETRLVHSGTIRSEFGETSEALFLTQGYVYDSAEQCEARFKGEDPGYIYSRYSNPTIAMFERRMIELEGAEAGRSTAHRHGRGDDGGSGAAESRRSRGRRESDVRIVPLRGGRPAAALRHFVDAGRRPRSRPVAQGDAAEYQELLPGKPDQSDARRARHRRHRRDRASGRRAADRRQRVRNADLAEPARRSAPMSWCIPRPSTSTARAAASAE